jgi:hypothetical protein
MIKAGKKRYYVSLNEASVDKAQKVLKVAGFTLSSYLSVLVNEFVRLIDESGYSKILDAGIENLKASDALVMITNILAGAKVAHVKKK